MMKHKIKDGIEKSSIHFGIKKKPYIIIFLKKWDVYVQNIIQLNPKYQEIKIKNYHPMKQHLLKFLINLNIIKQSEVKIL